MSDSPFSEKYLANYHPGPVSVVDIIDGEVRTHGSEWYQESPKRVSQIADELAELCLKVMASPQEILELELIDAKKDINKSKLRAYILSRIEIHLATRTEEGEHIEQSKRVFTATVDLVYQQYGSVRILINDPQYKGSRTVYIDDLPSVIAVLGYEPKKGTLIKVTNVRRERTTKTKAPKGTRTWQNQIIADICPDQV